MLSLRLSIILLSLSLVGCAPTKKTVKPIKDTSPPVITLNGKSTISLFKTKSRQRQFYTPKKNINNKFSHQ